MTMKPNSGSQPRLGRERPQIVYVHSFGSHRSGSVIRYGGHGDLQCHEKGALAEAHTRPVDKAASTAADRMSPGRARRSSPRGGRNPSVLLATGMSAKGDRRRGSLSLREGGKTKIKKGVKDSKAVTEPPSAPNNSQSGKNVAKYPTACSSQKPTGGYQEFQGDIFEFPSPLENAGNMILQQKKKFAVWSSVSKVISKMVEENEHFRKRLMSCNQRFSEVKDEDIFGWV